MSFLKNDLDGFKPRQGFDRAQYITICFVGFIGFFIFRVLVALALFTVMIVYWCLVKPTFRGGVLHEASMLIQAFIEWVWKKVFTVRVEGRFGIQKEVNRFDMLGDLFKAAKVSPQNYRIGWVTLGFAVPLFGCYLYLLVTGQIQYSN